MTSIPAHPFIHPLNTSFLISCCTHCCVKHRIKPRRMGKIRYFSPWNLGFWSKDRSINKRTTTQQDKPHTAMETRWRSRWRFLWGSFPEVLAFDFHGTVVSSCHPLPGSSKSEIFPWWEADTRSSSVLSMTGTKAAPIWTSHFYRGMKAHSDYQGF